MAAASSHRIGRRPAATDWARGLGLTVTVAVASLWAAGAWADGLPDGWLRRAADPTLLGKLEPGACGPAAVAGCRIERSFRDAAVPGALVMETAVRPAGKDADGIREVPLLDLSFRLRASREDKPYEPLQYRNAQWYGSTFWTGPDWTRVGKDWHHPGENTPSIRRFDVPRDGRVTISGRVYKLHLVGDGVRLAIFHGDRQIWTAEIDGKDSQGVEPNLTLDVRRGESLRFVVHKRGAISCDTTHWDPVVTYADGTRHQASESFSTEQGKGGWFYEMPAGAANAEGPPTLHFLSPDLSLGQAAVGGAGVAVSQADALPFLVLSDGRDASGLVVAVDATGPWTLRCLATDDGLLKLSLLADAAASRSADGLAGPTCLLLPYTGPWTAGMTTAQEIAATSCGLDVLRDKIASAYAGLTDGLRRPADLDLFVMAQADWRLDDAIAESVESYSTAVGDHLQRTAALLETRPSAAFSERLAELSEKARADGGDLDFWRRLYLCTRLLKRDVLLADPLADFDAMLVCKRVPPSWSHLVAQYFGWRQRPGGGLFVLGRPGCCLSVRDVVAGKLPQGSYLEPCLSYDARRIVFSFVACDGSKIEPGELPVNEQGSDDHYYHVYEINVDGTGLRQLTAGPYDDMMPAYLPDGGIAFCSTRRQSYSRCFGPEYSPRWDAYTIHRMDADGGNLRILSLNDVNEWFPAVSNTGHLLFARWDYIDRDAVTHQNLWAMRPDGTNPTAVWGNAAAKPNCTFQAKPVPGSEKIVFVAAAHHAITGGPVCLVDPTVDANSQAALTRVTPGPFPEAESGRIPEYYESPWPLSEDLFLVAYSRQRLRFQGEHPRNPNPDNALGIYLLDTAGNRELIYRDPLLSSTNPTPLVPRRRPPVLASALAEQSPGGGPAEGEMLVTDVYQGLGDLPRGSIKQLRIVEIHPKTTPLANSPLVGFAGEENTRTILGTVPIEADGSAYFKVPAARPVYFQALDAEGFAYQTMRSSTYVQRGERTSCIGCHEHRMSAPAGGFPMAVGRKPSTIDPGELGGRTFSFVEVVQPVLDRQCVRCHGGDRIDGGIDLTDEPQAGFTKSYWSLCGGHDGWQARVADPETAAADLVPRFWQRNQIQVTPPGGKYGALGSRLIKLLRDGHEDVRLEPGELRRIAAWIDLNAVFHGSYQPEGE